jgi:hypothetical protein
MSEALLRNTVKALFFSCVIVLVLAAALAPRAAQAASPGEPPRFIAAGPGVPTGVVGYGVTVSSAGEVVIAVLDNTGGYRGQITVHAMSTDAASLEFLENGKTFRLLWAKGDLQLATSDGEYGALHPDIKTRAYAGDPASMELLQTYSAELVMVAAAISDVRSAPGGILPDILYQDPGDGIGGGGGGGCSGFPTSGWGYDFRLSSAIMLSTWDANQKCSNQWCWGCCELHDPDCACAYGAFYCFCSRLGRACSDEDVGF